jgi:hypothetical protein
MVDLPPEDEQQEVSDTGSSLTRLIPWVLMLGLALLILPLYLGAVTIEESTFPLATEAQVLQATITAPPPVPPQEQTLTTELLGLRSQLGAFESVPATLIAGHTDWPRIMDAVHTYDSNRVRLTGFNNEPNRLIVNGLALEENAVLEYSRLLEGTGFFSQVRVQSISRNPVALPTPDLSATPNPEAPLGEIYMPFVFTLSVDLKANAGVSDGSG